MDVFIIDDDDESRLYKYKVKECVGREIGTPYGDRGPLYLYGRVISWHTHTHSVSTIYGLSNALLKSREREKH